MEKKFKPAVLKGNSFADMENELNGIKSKINNKNKKTGNTINPKKNTSILDNEDYESEMQKKIDLITENAKKLIDEEKDDQDALDRENEESSQLMIKAEVETEKTKATITPKLKRARIAKEPSGIFVKGNKSYSPKNTETYELSDEVIERNKKRDFALTKNLNRSLSEEATSIENKKINNIDDFTREDEEKNKYLNKIQMLIINAIDKHLSDDPILRNQAEELKEFIREGNEKEYNRMSSKEEEKFEEEIRALCENKDLFTQRIKELQIEKEKSLLSTNIDTPVDTQDAIENSNVNTVNETEEKENSPETNKNILVEGELKSYEDAIKKEEIEKQIDDKLDMAREKYLIEYNKCKKESDKQNLITKTKNSILNFFRSKDKQVNVKVEDFFTKELNDSKKEYDKARIEKGNHMYAERKSELEKAGLKGDDLENALINYKATEILSKTIIEERQKLIDLKASGAPIKPALWKRVIDGYMSIKPRWKRVALSTMVFLPLAGAGAVGAAAFSYGAAGVASLAAVKFTSSMLIGAGVGQLAKGIDWAKKGADQKFKEKINDEKQKLKQDYAEGKINLEWYEKQMGVYEEEERKRNRNRMLLKAGVGGALAITAGFVAYDAMGHGIHHIDSVNGHVDATTGADIKHIQAGNPRPPLASAGNNQNNNPFNTKYSPWPTKVPEDGHLQPGTNGVLRLHNNLPHANIEATADHGQGAISTLRELQHNLKVEYGNNLDNAPASVKHILNTDAHKLAQEYGMYKPGQDAESAFIKSGSSFRVDGNGNVTYHEVGGHNDITLEKGSEVKVNTQYEGRMSDTDHSSLKHNTEGNIPDDKYKMPPQTKIGTEEPIKIENNSSNLIDNKYKLPTQTKIGTNEPMTGGKDSIFSENPTEKLTPQNNLNPEMLEKVNTNYQDNIKYLFPGKDIRYWDDVKNSHSTEQVMKLYETGGLDKKYTGLAEHIKHLKEISGEKIIGNTLTTKAESMPEYIMRATKKAAEMGQLDKTNVANNTTLLHENTSLGNTDVESLKPKQGIIPDKVSIKPTQEVPLSFEDSQKVMDTWIDNASYISGEGPLNSNVFNHMNNRSVDVFLKTSAENDAWRSLHQGDLSMYKEEFIKNMHDKISTYINKLEKVTGLKPRLSTEISGGESTDHYINRALDQAQRMGKLDEVKL